MKKSVLLISIMLILFTCSKDNPTKPEDNTPKEDSSFFFPLTVGNIWYYYEGDHTEATQSIRVWESFTQDDTTYVLYGNKASIADTLFQDRWGRVYNRFGGKNLLWLDFSAEDGETYQYTLSEKLDYTVTVTRMQTVEFHNQKFEGCIVFEFDVPNISTEEETIVLAPDVGIVKRQGAWTTRYLKSWEFK